jgi:hypothetical protein
MGKNSFVNRTIKNWKQIPVETPKFSLVKLRFLETDLRNEL